MKTISPKALQTAAKNLAAADLARRQAATTILTPEMVGARSKKSTTAASRLTTTLGGSIRPITNEDLKQFKRAVQTLQTDRKHVSGITSREAIAQSTPADVSRCKAEIAHAVPFRFAGGVVSFQTSASRKHEATRHIVQLNLTGWEQAVGSPTTPIAAAKAAADQPLRFECDCGRHTFFYRYVATIGGWNHGRVETGFPKIRNPKLKGVACKHVLRVLLELAGAGVRGQIARSIQQERQRLAGKTRKTVLSVQKAHASKITETQAAKPRDVEKTALKLRKLLAGKVPSATASKKPTQAALEREAAATRERLVAMGWPRAQADQVAAAILATGAQ